MSLSFFWDVLNLRSSKDPIMAVLRHEKCCGLYSVRVGALLITFMSFAFPAARTLQVNVLGFRVKLFSSCIVTFDWLAIHWSWKRLDNKPHENISDTWTHIGWNSSNFSSAWDDIFPWLHHSYLPLWILIPVAVVLIISLLGFLGALLKWSILLIPYCAYRFFWFMFSFIFFLPFLFCEFLVLLLLSFFPKCPYFLIILTWIVNVIENIFVAIIVSELMIVIIEFHLMSVIFGCYQGFVMKIFRTTEEIENGDVADDLMHASIEGERQKNYQTIVPVHQG